MATPTSPAAFDPQPPADRLVEVVALLADGRFHSGTELGRVGGITRAAVWKLVRQLRHLGVPVDAVKGRGYRLPEAVELLDPKRIIEELAPPLPVEVAFTCPSTNALLLERARAGAAEQALLAELQSAGRGRWGRNWIAPFGGSLCLSVLYRFPPLAHGLAGLSLAIGVALAEALTAQGAPVKLKWPNDLILDGRKLGGILIELAGEIEGPCAVVIGLGLNLAGSPDISRRAEQPTADLAQVLGQAARERNRLAACAINAIARACQQFAASGFAPFLPRWSSFDEYLSQPVVLTLPDEEVRGVVRGVDARGALLLERDGRIESRFSGDLRLRLRRDPVA